MADTNVGVYSRRRTSTDDNEDKFVEDFVVAGGNVYEESGGVSRRGNAASDGVTRRMRATEHGEGGLPRTDSEGAARSDAEEAEEEDHDSKETRLTLMEEILLLGLKDREGYTSFWNDCISSGLRGAILIELSLRGRVSLEPAGMRRRSLLYRNVVLLKEQPTGDVLLDETLKHIRDNEPATVKSWIEYLSGETWNPMKLRLQLRNVRERIAKNLTEKGVCTTEKQNFVVFDMTTHPLVDGQAKQRLLRRVQDGLLSRWSNDPHRSDERLLSIIMLAQSSDVLENALGCLSDDDYDLAMKRVHGLLNLDFDAEALKEGACSVMWAVFASFNN